MIKLMNKMETSFYHDEPSSRNGMDDVKKRKMTMTLDLDKPGLTKKQKLCGILASPDLNLLKLASPELERMIIQQNGMITTTPTPTQIVFPKYVTEEQEAYARGFIDALAELHNKSDDGENSNGGELPLTVLQTASPAPAAVSTANFSFSTVTSLPGAIVSSGGMSLPTPVYMSQNGSVASTTVAPRATPTYTTLTNVSAPATTSIKVKTEPADQRPIPAPVPRISMLKEEPQTVPCMGNTPPMSPINMEHQEDIKLERKRERNRVAARKCRTRKLERISRLEERVAELKGQNSELTQSANTLREQVCKLKQQIMDHVNSGCQLMSQNLS